MTKQTIKLGTPPKGSDGDTTRVGFEKANDNFDELYARAQTKLTKPVSGAGTVALTASEALSGIIDLTGALTGARVVTVPADPPQAYTVRNSTTGTFSLTFQTASGTGVVLKPGQSSIVFSDGANIVDPVATGAPGRLIGIRVLTSSGTYTPTPGTNSILVEVQGAGGAGGGAAATGAGQFAGGSGGAAGAYAKSYLQSGFAGVPYVVGAGGVGVAGSAGGTGGSSSFGSLILAWGGSGGLSAPAASGVNLSSSAGGTASGGNICNVTGNSAGWILVNSLGTIMSSGGVAMLGAGGAPSVPSAPGGYGGGGGSLANAQNAAAAAGCAGAQGVIVIWEFA